MASPLKRTPKEPKKLLRLNLQSIDIVSAVKVGFFIGIALAVSTVVGIWLLWTVLSNSGVIGSVGGLLSSVLGEENNFNLEQELAFSNVMNLAFIAGLLNIVLSTALAGVYAAIFNVIAKLVGGVRVTFSNN
jgi:flagellar biosynthesis protein FlhB